MPPTEAILNRQTDVALSSALARSSRILEKKENVITTSRSPKGSGGGSTSFRKSSLLRITSPLTPWGNEEELLYEKRRKISIKSSGKSKNSKEKKSKKETGKGLTKKSSSTEDQELNKSKSTFKYYPDITQYMSEYRHVRNRITAGHRNCTCHGLYGPDEIDKVYESLGLPKILYKLRTYTANASSKNQVQAIASNQTLPALGESEENESTPDKSEDESEVDEKDQDRLIPSPEARKLKRNLNLSPLRKQVRLPDVRKYPVQSVSGLNMQEVVRLATARGETRKEELTSYTPKLRYTSMDRHQGIVFPPFHLHEKTMCRVVELSLPNSLPTNSPNSLPSKQQLLSAPSDHNTQTNTNKVLLPLDVKKTEDNTQTEKQKFRRQVRSRLSPESDDQRDDPLTLAIGTSRSSQSSVLSQAVSSLDNGGTKSVTTVREMLTAAVRDLQPFGINGVVGDLGAEKLLNFADEQDCNHVKSTKPTLEKQIVPSKAYRNLGYKPSMRKFLQELYTPSNDSPTSLKFKNNPCLIAGKPLNKTSPSENFQQDSDSIFPPSTVLSKPRRRNLMGDNYESIRRVVALESKKPKLAIFAKCHTVVKPGVSIRGLTLT